ncbi:sodium:proton antiporter [Halomonas sabkhae]|uniref:nickel/cobalt transporter n=1 Tax=Halomonas sabkhae TaxID=626223 RepID=UPI0025B59567|nr:sodium:proton antiporter [Halomonas sabkhae]MDN3525861.1 sodium:proton antiporter [Halomonas sabkhae]
MHDFTERHPRLLAWSTLAGVLVLVGVILLVSAHGQSLSLQIISWQRDLHRGLTLAISELSGAPSLHTWSILLGLSFGYGVFHAAGPGHGKAVLGTYLLTQGGAWRRALGLSCAAALLQALVAIALVTLLVHGLGWLTRTAVDSVIWVERASYLAIMLLGVWLCWRALRQWRSAARPATPPHAPHHDHADHAAHHGHDCDCAHHVTPADAGDWRSALLTVASIGMRPCSGAVLMMGAASLLGHYGVGVLATLSMAVGTALTVSALALLSVMARDWAEKRLAGAMRGAWWQRLVGGVALAGGVLILLLGLSLLLSDPAERNALPLLDGPGSETETTDSASPLGI